MTQFTHDAATAMRCVQVIEQLLEVSDSVATATATAGTPFEHDHETVAPTAWSWWMLVGDSARLVFDQMKAGNGLLVAPVVRNLMNHALALTWLIDGGELAVRAVDAYSDEEMLKLLDHAKRAGWEAEGEEAEARLRQAVEDRQSRLTPEITKLKNELSTPINLMTAYGVEEAYLSYRALSAYSHTTRDTGKLYLEANLRDRRSSPRPPSTYSDVIGTAVSLVQAGQAINRVLTGQPLTQPLQQAARYLGLPDDLTPRRRPTSTRTQRRCQPPAQE
jgi:hypothetical protein